ncbi:hypothetical protein, partial [Escherichia coli]
SETWLYQYFPPAPDKRQYVDDRVMSYGQKQARQA